MDSTLDASAIPIEKIRRQFPALAASEDVILDNAGGSQVPQCVADAIHRYMTTSYVQLGAQYETSQRCTELVDRAHRFVELFVGAGGAGSVILGPSTTALIGMLTSVIARSDVGERNEIVVSDCCHEANAGPWYRLEDRGFRLRRWSLDGATRSMRLEDLEALLGERTRMVAVPHVSNVFGRIEDVGGVIERAHQVGAEVIVDGVACAPHRLTDVAPLGADWYVYSTYKVFGPHMGALFGRHESLERIPTANHQFIPRIGAYAFEPGGVSHEGCAGIVGLWEYLALLGGGDANAEPRRDVIVRAFELIESRETALQSRLLRWIDRRDDMRIIGPAETDARRVSTISFVHEQIRSERLAAELGARRFGVRHGHCYSHRLCTTLAEVGDLHDVEDGVLRVSLLHYNTDEEIDRFCDALGEIVEPS